ncbi:MAG: tetratricopeptide repeat protein [Candidatus Gastranaerophilaceae bacterium]
MEKTIIKQILKITLALSVFFLVCEVVNIDNENDKKVSKPANAAEKKEDSDQYIPMNLDYSEVIKQIKIEEGVWNEDEEAKSRAQLGNYNQLDLDTRISPSEYFNIAKESVREALNAYDEPEKRYKVRKALMYYKEYLKHYPGNIEALLGAGAMATYLGREEESKQILMEAYATYPKNPAVHKALGDFYYKFSNFNNAIEFYNLSLLSGNLADYGTNLATAVCYEKLGDKERAIEYYKVCLHLNPESEIAQQRLEMYEKFERDGYQSDSRMYEDAIRENDDVELEMLILDSQKIK